MSALCKPRVHGVPCAWWLFCIILGKKAYKFEEILPIYKVVSKADDGTFAEYREGFKTFDREGHGFISLAELRYMLTTMGKNNPK